jgi:hypothetical protein
VNDIDLVRELRAEVTAPTPSRLADGRARLQAVISPGERPRPVHLLRAKFLIPALAGTVAAAVGIGYAAGGHSPAVPSVAGRPVAPPSASRSGPPTAVPPVTQAVLAAQLLTQASSVVGRAPVKAEPAPGQWVYSKTVDYQKPGGANVYENWETFDGRKSAYFENGHLIVHDSRAQVSTAGLPPLAAYDAWPSPKTAYDAIASLPADPRALLRQVGADVSRVGADNVVAGSVMGSRPKTGSQAEFAYLGQLLWNAAAGVGGPPRGEAAVFRAMALIPGVSLQKGVTDAAGHLVVGLSANGGANQLLLDPVSYQPTGLRAVFPIQKAAKPSPAKGGHSGVPGTGTALDSLAYLTVKEVSKPGAR